MTFDNEKTISAYDRDASFHFERFEAFDPRTIHAPWLRYLPQRQLKVIDIGAGSGRDANFLQSLGHDVTAIEPATGMLELARAKYPSINWLQDTLPELTKVTEQYDLTCCINVLMFLVEEDRKLALQRLLDITMPGGYLAFSLRIGAASVDLPRFDVPESEFDMLAEHTELLNREIMADGQSREGVTFLKLIYRKNS